MASPRPTISRKPQGPSPTGAAEAPKPGDAADGGTLSANASEAGPAVARTGPAWVLVARLVRPHGRRGELVAEILTDFPERFHERTHLFLIPPERVGSRGREMELESFWFLRSRIVMKFRGVESINDAEGLRGFEVAIPAAERAPLEAGAVYISDLIGCRVIDLNQDGADVGEIVDVDRETSSSELLVVRRRDRRPGDQDVLIPFVADFVVRIDATKREVLMRLAEGLLDINAPMSDEEKREAGGE